MYQDVVHMLAVVNVAVNIHVVQGGTEPTDI